MYELPIRGRIAAVATAMLIAFSGLAAAGECPVGKVKEGAVTSGPMAPVGVTDTVLASIDLSKIPRDRASYGSTLVLYDAEREEEVTYRLVTPEESDPAAGLISTVSPIGRSLMGKEAGDEVVVTIPSGSRRFEIRRLMTLHDEAKKGPAESD